MKEKTSLWIHNLAAAVITGGSTTALAALGILGAEKAGVQVTTLDYKQCVSLFIAGALVGLLSYLKASPLPPEE